MAILYVFKVTDPENVGPFPPSVVSSSWFTGLTSYINTNTIGTGDGAMLMFANETALNSFLDTYRCTDATLIADIAAWKTAHNITYNNWYCTVPEVTPTPTPLF